MAKNMLLWLAIAAVLLSVFNNFSTQGQKEQLGYSAFIQEVQNNRLSKVVVDGLTISAERTDGSSFETIRPMVEDPKLMDDLRLLPITSMASGVGPIKVIPFCSANLAKAAFSLRKP